MTRTKIVVANWKMHGNTNEINEWQNQLNQALTGVQAQITRQALQIVVCLPSPYLSLLKDSPFALGAQDCHSEMLGAYTGDVSAVMLQDLGVSYVLVGHSERRAGHAESNAIVQAKAKTALEAGIVPIICVGESLEVRDRGDAEKFTCEQLRNSLPFVKPDDEIIVAYEPVWAIGTGHKPNSKQVQSMLVALRATLESISTGLGDKTRLLYGGSVSADNVADFCAGDSDGVLVGGACLKAEGFANIIQTLPSP